jgi:hypothetical protein
MEECTTVTVQADQTLDLGFETVGNATLIVHDGAPVLATDPWLSGSAYFGSWGLTHEIPEAQLASIRSSGHVWISHGHPDHLSWPSLQTLTHAKILLPDHLGGRIFRALADEGFDVAIAPDREWMQLSPRVRVMSISDIYQDAVLLVDLDGVLVINANDATDHGWGRTVRKAAKAARTVFLLALSGYGDADMINYFTPTGERIPPRAARREPPGPAILERMKQFHAQYFVPFASHHRYERTDSAWANDFTTKLGDYAIGFEGDARHTLLPAFIRYDCQTGNVTRLDPPARAPLRMEPEAFGDDWDELLTDDDVETLRRYFGAITSLRDVVDTVTFRVGGEDHEIPIAPADGQHCGRRIVFEVPRGSLMTAVRLEIFDDLLIGNYMRTTLLGEWETKTLRPDFTAYVAKYADNGEARTPGAVAAYLSTYRRRAPIDTVSYRMLTAYRTSMAKLGRKTNELVRPGSFAHRVGSRIYRRIKV